MNTYSEGFQLKSNQESANGPKNFLRITFILFLLLLAQVSSAMSCKDLAKTSEHRTKDLSADIHPPVVSTLYTKLWDQLRPRNRRSSDPKVQPPVYQPVEDLEFVYPGPQVVWYKLSDGQAMRTIGLVNSAQGIEAVSKDVVFVGGLEQSLEATYANMRDYGFLGGASGLPGVETNVLEGLGIGKTLYATLKGQGYEASTNSRGVPELSLPMRLEADPPRVDIRRDQAPALADVLNQLQRSGTSKPVTIVTHSYGALSMAPALRIYFEKLKGEPHNIDRIVMLAPGVRNTYAAFFPPATADSIDANHQLVATASAAFDFFWGSNRYHRVIHKSFEDAISRAAIDRDPKVFEHLGLLTYYGETLRTIGMIDAKSDEEIPSFPKGVPVVVVVPELENLVPAVQIEWLRRAAVEAGVDLRIFLLTGQSHNVTHSPPHIQAILNSLISGDLPDGTLFRLSPEAAINGDNSLEKPWQDLSVAEWHRFAINQSNAVMKDSRESLKRIGYAMLPLWWIRKVTSEQLAPPERQ